MVTPKPLFEGARVALIAMSGPIGEGRLEPAVEAVRAFGLEPVVYDSCFARRGYLAGDDRLRADDVMRAFLDPTIDGVLCARGGYGAHRVLPLLDLEAIAKHPKYFAGYSDVTAMHIALNGLGIVGYHAPMPTTEWYKPLDSYTLNELRRAMFGGLTGDIPNAPDAAFTTLSGGVAEGRLAGGNLSLVHQSLKTPWEIDTRGRVLFLEDVGEKPYRIDAMLTGLKNAGKLAECVGLVLGYFTDCSAEDAAKSLSLDEVFADILLPLNIPVLAGLACGHAEPTCSLPIGAPCRLDATKQTLTIL